MVHQRPDTAFPVDPDRPRVTVIGTGYLGATQAVCMAMLGCEVLGVDVDPRKVESLSRGIVPFYEPGLDGLLREALATGRLRFSTDFDEAARFGDVHFVCVGTPQARDSEAADLRFVEAAFTELGRRLTRRALLVGKSTVPVGTAARLATRIRDISPGGELVEVAWNPEFLREGFAIEDTMRPDRLVFGVSSAWSEQMLRASYAPILEAGVPLVVTDLATAEMVKVAANAFLATKISFINAMAEVCERAGADVSTLSTALGYDLRIGSRFLKAGLGFGGGCLPKDIRAFRHRAEELGAGQAVAFLREVDAINLRRRVRVVDLGRELVGGRLEGLRVAALGAAFKPDSDDVRDAPALDVARMLAVEGASVVVYDPRANENAHRVYPHLEYAGSLAEAAAGADLVLLLTEWSEFVTADPVVLGRMVRHRRMIDARDALDRDAYAAAGWRVSVLGRSASAAAARVPDPRTGAAA